ncbi:MAG TPA: NAD(P)-binding domain-containing protein [Polyangium sp.]|nr:NAD(P)-binding domain-containing protein [Polyangium sp.]
MADSDRRDQPSPDKPVAAQKTLYAAPLGDARDRAAVPREVARGRAARRAETTSDVTRFRGFFPAALAAAITTAVSAFAFPPPGGHSSPGPLSKPHAKASLTCANCHGSNDAPKKADESCGGCHGPHPSQRRGHARLQQKGVLKCSNCHPIHYGDQGVVFNPGKDAVRFAPGAESSIDLPDSRAALGPAVVPIVTFASCERCHDPTRAKDPIARCLIPGQEKLGPDRPEVCFDEHQVALPDDRAPRAVGFGKPQVCSKQHGEDRAVLWDAAREVAISDPVLVRPVVGNLAWVWLGTGMLAFGLTFGFVRGGRGLLERVRRNKQGSTPEALVKPQTRVRLPQINTQTCIGCYACVDACPYDVLDVQKYVAVVVRPEACCGLTLCEQRCPNGSLRVTDGETIGDRPRMGENLESTDTPGLFLAGDVTGLPLIKNAILQGSLAVDKVVASLGQEGGWSGGSDKPLDLIIIGAGPAGISAALRAKELGLSFQVVEQGSVAQSIRSFPRGKLVFDQPLDLPLSGKLWLEESTKEELLSHWMRIVRKAELPIHQDTRMTGVERDAQKKVFRVMTEPREGGASQTRLSRRVLIAIGQRGTPRRLPIALDPDLETRVHYHLADARSFEGKRVVVVGLGDVAMETAMALARQPGTTVTVVHRGKTFTRGKARNIEELERMAKSGRLTLRFDTEVAAIDKDHAMLRTGSTTDRVLYDAIFVMIGSIPPWNTLRALGVRAVADEDAVQARGRADTLVSP